MNDLFKNMDSLIEDFTRATDQVEGSLDKIRCLNCDQYHHVSKIKFNGLCGACDETNN